jgi:hypothetical protein
MRWAVVVFSASAAALACSTFASGDAGSVDAGGRDALRADDERFAFVTSETLPGNFAASERPKPTLARADELCAREAMNSTLAGRHWVAWLALGEVGAYARLRPGVRWVNVRGDLVFASTEAMRVTQAAPRAPIRQLNGGVTAEFVWTGTVATGDPDNAPVGTSIDGKCADWATQALDKDIGNVGRASTAPTWSFEGHVPCSNSYPIFCFEE